MTNKVLLVLVVAAEALTGCSPGMHRAYQRTMASAASGMFMFDGAQTVAAVKQGTPEGNMIVTAMFGDHPKAYQTWAVAGSQAIAAPLILLIPGTRGGDDTGEYLKDGLLTCLAMLEGFTVYVNASNRNLPIMSSWH